jgi:hypothetical protein
VWSRGILALALLAFPYLALYLAAPPGQHYTGVLFNPSDSFLYLAQMAHGHGGQLGFVDYFTHLHEPPLPIYTLYSATGLLTPTAITPLAGGIAFHLARLGLCGLFVWQLWKLLGELLPRRAARRLALVMVLFTAGAGLFQILLGLARPGEPPYDLFITESSTFAGLVFAPHFALVLLLLVVYLRALWRVGTGRGPTWRATLAGAAAALLLSTIHPDKIVVLAVTSALFLLHAMLWGGARRRRRVAITQGALMLAGGLPYFAYSFSLVLEDPQIAQLLRQGLNHESVPDPLVYYLFGFGIPGLLALTGLPRFLRDLPRREAGEVLLWSFAAGGLLLIAVPYHDVGHRGEGLQLALAALAARTLVRDSLPRLWRSRAFAAAVRRHPLGYGRRRLRLLSLNLVVILSAPSVLALSLASVRAGLAISDQVYVGAADRAALGWLRANAGPQDVVAGDPFTGQFVAAYGGTHVVFGQQAYTPDFTRELLALSRFFRGLDAPRDYLAARGVTYLYWGPRERGDATFDPATLTFLEPVYRSGSTTLYRVRPAAAPATAARIAEPVAPVPRAW